MLPPLSAIFYDLRSPFCSLATFFVNVRLDYNFDWIHLNKSMNRRTQLLLFPPGLIFPARFQYTSLGIKILLFHTWGIICLWLYCFVKNSFSVTMNCMFSQMTHYWLWLIFSGVKLRQRLSRLRHLAKDTLKASTALITP